MVPDTQPTTMHTARRAYRRVPPSERQGVSFRAWARKTFTPATATGKLVAVVVGGARRGRGRR